MNIMNAKIYNFHIEIYSFGYYHRIYIHLTYQTQEVTIQPTPKNELNNLLQKALVKRIIAYGNKL